MAGRLSTCATCGGTITYRAGTTYYWTHVSGVDAHRPDPDDGAVSRPDRDDTDTDE